MIILLLLSVGIAVSLVKLFSTPYLYLTPPTAELVPVLFGQTMSKAFAGVCSFML